MNREEAIAEENRRLEQLKTRVDRAQKDLREGRIAADAVDDVAAELRQFAERLFPGQGGLFDMIYRPRLERAAREAR